MRNSTLRCISLIFLVLLFWGCVTAPPEYFSEEVVYKLPGNMEMYIGMKVFENRDFIKDSLEKAGFSTSDLGYIIDGADRLYAGADMFNGKGLFYGIFAGSFNTFLVNTGLGMNSDWQLLTIEGMEWYRQGDLYVAFEGDNYFYVSNADPRFFPIFGGESANLQLDDFEWLNWDGLTAVIPLPSEAVMGEQAAKVPVEKLNLLFEFKESRDMDLSGTFYTNNEKSARTLKVLIRFVLGKWVMDQNVDFSERLNQLTVDYEGRYLNFGGYRISQDEIVQILRTLLVGE